MDLRTQTENEKQSGMSEYQYYEFQAIDRTLTDREMTELRSYSTRAEIDRTSFVNTYNFGNFKGDPKTFMEKYFDAFLYVANWGSHELMFRLPETIISSKIAALYCGTDRCRSFSSRVKDDFVIFHFDSEEEGGDWEPGESESLSSLIPIRSDLMSGDLRSLYLGWLLRVEKGELDNSCPEPPVPPGLGQLSASLESLVDFLRLDRDLLEVAALKSPKKEKISPSQSSLKPWLKTIADSEKEKWLLDFLEGKNLYLRPEIIQKFQDHRTGGRTAKKDKTIRRTVGQLTTEARTLSEEKQKRAAILAEKKKKKEEEEKAKAREQYLNDLAKRENQAWLTVEELFKSKRSVEYDQAVHLLKDLKDVSLKCNKPQKFQNQLKHLREQYRRKHSLMSRLDQANLTTPN